MNFRFTLSHDILGSQVIDEPAGWKDAKLRLERHNDFHSLIEHYDGGNDGGFMFYGDNGEINGGVDFIRDAELVYGLDVELNALVELSFDAQTYETIFTGQVDVSEKTELVDNKIEAPIIRDDFWSTFINRMDTPVSLSSLTDLDGNAVSAVTPIDMYLPSQKIVKKIISNLSYGTAIFQGDITLNGYIQFDFDNETLSEIDTKHHLYIAANPERPVSLIDVTEAGDYTFNIRIETSLIRETGGGIPACAGTRIRDVTSTFMEVLIQKNDDTPLFFTKTDFVTDSTVYSYSGTLNLLAGDQIRIYGSINDVSWKSASQAINLLVWGVDNSDVLIEDGQFSFNGVSCQLDSIILSNVNFGTASSADTNPTRFSVTANTVYPSTIAEGYLLHDAFYGVLQRIGLGNVPFYSEFLGSTLTNSKQYLSDGCGWRYAIIKGLQLRQYTLTEKPFFISFKQLWEGANPILNLGLSYTTILGVNTIQIEQKAEFYDTGATSMDFSNVRDISAKYDHEYIFKTIKTGYKKWQSEDISGIDDPQTKKTYATRFKKVGKEISIESEFIAASLAIETTRRTTREKSADYKFDNDTFIIALNADDVSPDAYGPELRENFDSVSNLLNSDTRYNLTLTPLRNFLRWANFFNGGLYQYQTSSYKFVSAEGNYDMSSDYSCSSGLQCIAILCDPLSEKQDISLTTYFNTLGYLFIPIEFTITVPLEWGDYETIRNNPDKPIGISQTSIGHTSFYIKELSYEIVKGRATIKAWPRTPFSIEVIENTVSMLDCSE